MVKKVDNFTQMEQADTLLLFYIRFLNCNTLFLTIFIS
jgi:hypothetical protein